jgi:uncharacterized damage-inducible protein DinB
MDMKDIKLLYEYNWWANEQMLDAVAVLSHEQFTKDLATSHVSVHGTLVHLLAAEWIWQERCKGISPKKLFDPAEFPTLESVREKLDEVKRDQRSYIDGLSDDSLESVIAYTNTKGEQWEYPIGQILQHVVNHSSYHRGQVTVMLRQLGAKAVMTDFLVYIDEKNKR